MESCIGIPIRSIKASRTAGFNNPAGRSQNSAVDLLEPADSFNISVPGVKVTELKAELKCRLRWLQQKGARKAVRSITISSFRTTPWTHESPQPAASCATR